MGRSIGKFIDSETVTDTEQIEWFAPNSARKVCIDIANEHGSQTLDYTVYGRIHESTGNKDTLQATATLAASSGDLLTEADISTLNDGYREIGIGYVQTDGSNKGTLTAYYSREY